MIKNTLVAWVFAVAVGAAWADVVTFKNGDHLTGAIEQITDTQVIFVSPAVGRITLDRSAIQTLHSENQVTITQTTATGPTTRKAYVAPAQTGIGWNETDQRQAAPISAATAPIPQAKPAAPAKDNRFTRYLYLGPNWNNQLALGYSGTTGNDESSAFNASVKLHYKKDKNELTMLAEGVHAVSNSDQTQGFARHNAVFRHDLKGRWFWFADDDVRYDGVKGISLAANAATGPGYYLFKGDKFNMDLRAGPGIFYQRRFDEDSTFAPSVEVGLRLSYKVNDRFELSNETTYTAAMTEHNDFTIVSETAAKFKLDLESGLGFKLAFQDQYDSQPSDGKDANDTRLIAALTLDF